MQTSEPRSSLFEGHVMHRRLAPLAHGFRYAVYMFALDLDDIARSRPSLWLFGVNRRTPVSFRDADHLPGPGPLRARVERVLAAHHVEGPIARITLLTNARVLGYVFNPVSFFFCYGAGERLAAIVAEVHNTFGESHVYVVRDRLWHDKKVFHVSPFLTLDGTYRFEFDVSPAHVDVRIDLHREGVPVFVSRLALDRRPLTDAAVASALVRYPWITVKVMAAIHWEALRLWWKGARYHPKPQYDPETARARTSA